MVSAGEEHSGGATTVFESGPSAFARPLANISRELRREHSVGNSFFNQNWVAAPSSTEARDGLGPIFNARSCSACHVKDGRGRPPEQGEAIFTMVLRLSIPGRRADGGPVPEPNYGLQFHPRSLPGIVPEGWAAVSYEEEHVAMKDGAPFSLRTPSYEFGSLRHGPMHSEVRLSPRVAPAVHGMGLLEAVPAAVILAHADPDDADGDGISGRPNLVPDLAAGGAKVIGRFGWKANEPTVRQQTAGAFQSDLGITTDLFPDEILPKGGTTAPSGGQPEADTKVLDRVTTYLLTLAPPARRNWKEPQVIAGKEIFSQIGCAKCHFPELKTGEYPAVPELEHQNIRPYTDLLLHDMGEQLADGREDYEAGGTEWRTPPLWGIGLQEVVSGHLHLLHDGRARGFAEAILWHGGEGEASREAFTELNHEEREALFAFLWSL